MSLTARTPGALPAIVLAGALALAGHPALAESAPADPLLPEPTGLQTAVDFWIRIYVEVDSDAGLIHDDRHLDVVYAELDLSATRAGRAQQRRIDARIRQLRAALHRLAGKRSPRTADDRRVLQAWEEALGRAPSARELSAAAERLRFQRGQRDRFRDGLIRAGRYESHVRRIFRAAGLPEDLAYLPHVESSFEPRAYSKYGAAGMWQFMRSTGRRYMRVGYVVDERLDPIAASRAAARLLRDNYASLGSWPLAITAYNHGAAGLRRAVRKVGSHDIVEIVERYRSRRFGFASRNFYAQFLAARRVARDAQRHFGALALDTPLQADSLALPFYVDAVDLERHLGVKPAVLARYNPALRPPALRSEKRIPKGYRLKLPAGTVGGDADAWLTALPASTRHSAQRRSRFHTVSRGETLSGIARLHGTSIDSIVALNGLSSRHRIRAGQVLELVGSADRAAPSVSSVPVALAVQAPAPQIASAPSEPARQPSIVLAAVSEASAPPAPGEDSRWRRIEGEQVTVDIGETLGHFAEWLDVPTQRLRNLNSLRRGRPIHMGQSLRLDFSRVSKDEFLARRIEYHKAIEEDFFGAFEVTGQVEHTLKRGENLWLLAADVYDLPMWLIHRYNPQADFRRLTPGSRLTIPVVEQRST